MKVLALDFGRARTGVAVSDPTGTLAQPLGVIEHAATEVGVAEIARIVAEQNAELVVVGMPLTMRGEVGEQARETEQFVALLSGALAVRVVTFDERFTTDLAEQTPARAHEDARAAAHILSGYLSWSSGARA